MSKGGTTVVQPSPPPQPSTESAVRAWVESLPQVYETQLQYLPQFATLAKSISEQLYPETASIQESLAQEAKQKATEEVPEWMRQQYLSNVNAQLGQNVASPVGADYVSRGLLAQQQDWANYWRNMQLNLAGRQQLVQPPTFQTMYGGFTPANVMNFKAGTYAPYAGAWGSAYSANARLAGINAMQPYMMMQGIGNVLGGIGRMGGLSNIW